MSDTHDQQRAMNTEQVIACEEAWDEFAAGMPHPNSPTRGWVKAAFRAGFRAATFLADPEAQQ